MNPIVKNILAVLAGLILGSAVNMGLVMLGPAIIPPPEGADVTTMEGLQEAMHLFSPRHFVFPFLAHALGALVGAFVAARIAASRKMTMGMVIGGLFLIGGIINVVMLPSPLWYSVLDLVGAYIPMAWIGATLATRNTSS